MDITQEADIFVDSLHEVMVKRALQKAEKAHHEYEEQELNGLRDNNWARWYAAFIKKNVDEDLFEHVSELDLEQALEKATTNQLFNKDYTWEDFTASYITHYVISASK